MSIVDLFSSCIWFSSTSTRNAVVALVSGLLFFVGWWLIIDASTAHGGGMSFAHHICGILGTLSLIMINCVDMNGDNYMGGFENRIRVWIFIGFILGFSSIIAATWIMIADFAYLEEKDSKWPGVALLMQNIFIFFSSLLYKFGRTNESSFGF